MREIKFRAWDGKELSYSHKDLGNWFLEHDDMKELMQFTGLKDKNGKEIYEGDILKFNLYYTIVRNGIVDISDNEDYGSNRISGFYLETYEGRYVHMDSYYLDDTEVIGNIYENPELLKKY